MNRAEYTVQLRSVFNLATLVRKLRLQELLQIMDIPDTAGPMEHKKLTWQLEIVAAALDFQLQIERIIKAYEASQEEIGP